MHIPWQSASHTLGSYRWMSKDWSELQCCLLGFLFTLPNSWVSPEHYQPSINPMLPFLFLSRVPCPFPTHYLIRCEASMLSPTSPCYLSKPLYPLISPPTQAASGWTTWAAVGLSGVWLNVPPGVGGTVTVPTMRMLGSSARTSASLASQIPMSLRSVVHKHTHRHTHTHTHTHHPRRQDRKGCGVVICGDTRM